MFSHLSLRPSIRRSVYIQRLHRPTGFHNVYSGVGPVPSEILSIFSFDYMGAAQFEWGAVPEALRFLKEQASQDLVISGNYRDVYYIAPRNYESGVRTIIEQLLRDEQSLRLAEYCGLSRALQDVSNSRTRGWLEIDNGFMFFIDQEMFDKTRQWLGL